jgi:thioredoxin 1
MGAAVEVTDASFKQEVLESKTPVLVDFWAEWCGPCRAVGPVLEELAGEFGGKIKITKMNVDHNQQTAAEFRIRSIPTLLFFKNGSAVKQLIGAYPKNRLIAEIDEVLKG